MKFCEECGAELEEGAIFCDECGAKVAEYENVPIQAVDKVEEVKVPQESTTISVDAPQKGVSKKKMSKARVLTVVIGGVILLLVACVSFLFGSGTLKFGGNKEPEVASVPVTNMNSQPEETAVPASSEVPVGTDDGANASTTSESATETTEENEEEEPAKETEKPKDDTYVIEYSDSAYLTEEDVEGFSKKKLRLARNEIYARHGYIFKDKELKKYFKKKAWYSPKVKPAKWSESFLNKYEKKNVKFLVNMENGTSVKNTNLFKTGTYECYFSDAGAWCEITINEIEEDGFTFVFNDTDITGTWIDAWAELFSKDKARCTTYDDMRRDVSISMDYLDNGNLFVVATIGDNQLTGEFEYLPHQLK